MKFIVGALLVAAALSSACAANIKGAVKKERLSQVTRVVVMPFKAPAGAPADLGSSVAEELTALLVESPFTIIERSRLDEVLKEQAFQASDMADSSNAAKVGAILGADGVIIGTVLSYVDELTTPEAYTSMSVSVRFVQASTGEIILSANAGDDAASTMCGSDMPCLRQKVVGEVAQYIVDATK